MSNQQLVNAFRTASIPSSIDSFGATSGSLLGAYFGPGYLEERWLKPFNDDIHTGLAWFFERSISKLAKRMSELPMKINT